MYNQPGPSNFIGAYPPQDARSQTHYHGRGRGFSNHRNTQPNTQYHQQPQQPYYTPVPMPYTAYGMPMSSQYNHTQTGLSSRRGGPNYQSGNFQTPGSPALPPTHIYGQHAPPYMASVPQTSSPSPLYHYSHPPAHIQHYSPYSPSTHIHFTPYSHAQNMKSPLISPLQEQQNTPSPRPLKSQTASPRPPPATETPLQPAQIESQTSPQPPSILPPVKTDIEILPQTIKPNSEPEQEPLFSPVASDSPKSPSPLTRSPEFPKFEVPSFIDEPAPKQEWVIASLPDDPSSAFGLMISPKAKPPPRIVQGAQKFKSSVTKSIKLSEPSPELAPETQAPPVPSMIEVKAETPIIQSEHLSSTETESHVSVTTDVFVPGSPLSTTTSISATAVKSEEVVEKEGQKLPLAESVTTSSTPQSPKPSASKPLPSGASPKTQTVKKSWASLFGSEGSSSKSSLPTSSVQGISIPSETAERPTSSVDTPVKQRDLLRLLTNGPGTTNNVPQIRPRGLVNTGNMCFANAVLQTLVYTPLFSRLFTELGKHISGIGPSSPKWDGKETPMVNATVDFLKEFKPREKTKDNKELRGSSDNDDDDFEEIDSFIPTHIYDAMKSNFRFEHMGGGQQEDAEEFFGFFLDTLEEDLLTISKSLSPSKQKASEQPSTTEEDGWLEVGKKNKAVITRSSKSIDSPITRIFGGKFRSTLKVPGQKDSVMLEDWRSLQLDIQREQVNTIEDALRYISHPQTVQVSSVTKGNAVVEATQQVMMDSFPPVLVLHLKRFDYDTTIKDVKKVHKQVNYGLELEIPSDVIAPSRRSTQPIKYKLYSVIYHHGQSAAGGHYTLDVLHPNRNSDSHARPREGWIRIDDELVSDLRSDDVFGKDRDCAYLLFYRRLGGTYASRAGQ